MGTAGRWHPPNSAAATAVKATSRYVERIPRAAKMAANFAGIRENMATQVRVELTCGGDELKLCVRDNGVGFDYDQSRFGAGLGLVSMRERMHLIGGRLRVNSQQKNGTLIEASIASLANLDSPAINLSPNLDCVAE